MCSVSTCVVRVYVRVYVYICVYVCMCVWVGGCMSVESQDILMGKTYMYRLITRCTDR